MTTSIIISNQGPGAVVVHTRQARHDLGAGTNVQVNLYRDNNVLVTELDPEANAPMSSAPVDPNAPKGSEANPVTNAESIATAVNAPLATTVADETPNTPIADAAPSSSEPAANAPSAIGSTDNTDSSNAANAAAAADAGSAQ